MDPAKINGLDFAGWAALDCLMLWEVNADKCHNKIPVWVFGAILVRFLASINPARLKLLSTSAELMRYHRYGMVTPRNGPGLWSDHWNVMLRPNGTPCVLECCYVCCMLDAMLDSWLQHCVGQAPSNGPGSPAPLFSPSSVCQIPLAYSDGTSWTVSPMPPQQLV